LLRVGRQLELADVGGLANFVTMQLRSKYSTRNTVPVELHRSASREGRKRVISDSYKSTLWLRLDWLPSAGGGIGDGPNRRSTIVMDLIQQYLHLDPCTTTPRVTFASASPRGRGSADLPKSLPWLARLALCGRTCAHIHSVSSFAATYTHRFAWPHRKTSTFGGSLGIYQLSLPSLSTPLSAASLASTRVVCARRPSTSSSGRSAPRRYVSLQADPPCPSSSVGLARPRPHSFFISPLDPPSHGSAKCTMQW